MGSLTHGSKVGSGIVVCIPDIESVTYVQTEHRSIPIFKPATAAYPKKIAILYFNVGIQLRVSGVTYFNMTDGRALISSVNRKR